MVASTSLGLGIDGGSPGADVAGIVGEAGDGGAEAVVAGPAEGDAFGFAGLVSHGSDAGLGGQMDVAVETFADATEFGKDLGGTDTAGAGEAHDDLAIVEGRDMVFDTAGEQADLLDQAPSHLDLGLFRSEEESGLRVDRAIDPAVGSYAIAQRMFDVYVMLAFGVIGFILRNAARYLERAVELQPQDPTVQLELAQAAQSAGDVATTIAAYERFLKLAPNDPTAPEIKRILKQLEQFSSSG